VDVANVMDKLQTNLQQVGQKVMLAARSKSRKWNLTFTLCTSGEEGWYTDTVDKQNSI